jgi:hypothetical protein
MKARNRRPRNCCGSAAVAAAALLAACASEPGTDAARQAAEAQPVTETIDVRMLGGGFVGTGGRRIPVDALVLELRQRTRAMDAAARLGLLVDVVLAEDAAANAARDLDRLLEQLQILGVRQATIHR